MFFTMRQINRIAKPFRVFNLPVAEGIKNNHAFRYTSFKGYIMVSTIIVLAVWSLNCVPHKLKLRMTHTSM